MAARAIPFTSGFIGRERELAELLAGLADVIAGHGHFFLLNGEPGIGKTRLADEFGRMAVMQGVRVVWGPCWEGGGAPAYWPWIQIVRACLAEAGAEQRTAIFGSELTAHVAQGIAQLLPELEAAHRHTARDFTPQLRDHEQARFQLFESVATLLKTVARMAPLVIVIDDLHDADHPSLLLQSFIASQIKDARILMVSTYRDTEVRQSPELSKLIGDLCRAGHSIPLAGLSQAEVGEFVESSSGEKADGKLVESLFQATDGNPLFVDGVVRLLIAEGRVDRAGPDGIAFKLPDGVRESILRRLVRLSEETNSMLSMASAIGNEFEARLLAEVSAYPTEQITERMEEATRAGIVIDGGTGDSRYRFSHALVREAVYKDLPARRRIELHRQIGAAIEKVYYDNLKPQMAALAHHFREGSIADKAIDYSILASGAAEAVFAYEDALAHLRPALALAEIHDHDSPRRADILLRLGRICVYVGNLEQGVAYLETALKIYEQVGDEQHAGEIHSDLGRVFAFFGPQMNVARALAHLQRAQALLEQTGEAYSLGLLYRGLAWCNLEVMQVSEALATSQKAMDIYARLGERELWAGAAGNHAQYLMVRGNLKQAVSLLDEIIGAAPSFADAVTFGNVIWVSGWFRMLMRNPSEALRIYGLGLKRSGLVPSVRLAMLDFLTSGELAVGNLVEAKTLAGDNFVNFAFRGRIAFFEGDWKVAGEMLQQSLDWAVTAQSGWNQALTLSYVVELRRITGDYDGALVALERALSLYSPDDLYWQMRIRPHGALVCVEAGRPEQAEEHLEHCRKVLAQQEDWLGMAGMVWRAEGVVAAAQGRFEQSVPYFEKTIEVCRQYSLRWEEAETLHYFGRALLDGGQLHRASEILNAAITLYRELGGGKSWIDRVEADSRRAQPPPPEPVAQSRATNAETPAGEAIFRGEGDFWTITYQGRTSRLKDMRGLHYIAYLLGHPNEHFHVRDLAAIAGGEPLLTGAAGAEPQASVLRIPADVDDVATILDHRAKAEYRARLSELRAELDQAERMNDSGRSERVRQELAFVDEELSAAIGLGGRDRKISDYAERARLRIGKAIRSAVSAIQKHDPSLGHHFSTCIRTGYYCAYTPDPLQQRSWKL